MNTANTGAFPLSIIRNATINVMLIAFLAVEALAATPAKYTPAQNIR